MRRKIVYCLSVYNIVILLMSLQSGLVLADYNYSFQDENIIGLWNNSGASNTTLNSPNHVFILNSKMYVSDTSNGRLMIYERSNWQFVSSISNFSFINGTEANISNIYETVVSTGGDYYSIIENCQIIRYNQSGVINETITLPVGFDELSPLNVAIGIDNTISNPIVLIKFFSEKSYEDLIGPYVYSYDDLQTPDDLTPLFNCTNEAAHFSYSNSHPVLISTRQTHDQKTQLVIAQFGEETSSYGVISLQIISTEMVNVAFTSRAWINFTKGMWFAGSSNRSNDANRITDHDVSFAGYFNTLISYGEIVGGINSLVYDQINDLVIVTSSKYHVVFGVKFLSVEKEIHTFPDDTDNNLFNTKWFRGFLYVIMATIVFVTYLRFREKKIHR